LAEAKQFKQELEARVQDELTVRQAEAARKQAEAEAAQQAHFVRLQEQYKQGLRAQLQAILDLQFARNTKEQELQKLSSRNPALRLVNGSNAKIESLRAKIAEADQTIDDIVRELRVQWWAITLAHPRAEETLSFLVNLPVFLLEGLANGHTTEEMVQMVLAKLEER
jgi:chromosome segregation ATPase